jgi:hypothetical protein
MTVVVSLDVALLWPEHKQITSRPKILVSY